MSKFSVIGPITGLLACATLAACAGPQPAPYTGIASASYMRPNPQDDSGKVPYRYSTQTNWASYSQVMVDPVSIYQGPDNQFGEMSPENRSDLAQYMQAKFSEALSKRFQIVSTPGPNTLRVKLTLTGAAGTPFIGKFAHLDMGGNVYNGIQAVRGGPGLESGWVMYAVEIHNAADGKLLEAYEAKEYPNAFNVNAAFGTMAAPKIGIDKGADALVAQLQ